MKILMVTNEYPPSVGGVQTHVYELSKALVGLGHRVCVATRLKNSSLPLSQIVHGVNVFRFKLAKSHLVYDWQLKRELQRLVNRFEIDVIHVHGMRPLNAAKACQTPVVFTNHTSSFLKRSRGKPAILRKMGKQLNGIEKVLAPSQVLVEQTQAMGYSGPVLFVPNGVDTVKFSPGISRMRQKLDIPDRAFVLLMSGRLHAVKGVVDLAKAVSLIDNPELHVVIVGEGPEGAKFETIARDVSCVPKIHLLGSFDNAAMPEVYRGADALALPSRMEATSIAGLEAMASGLPIIGSRVGGIPVLVQEGQNGLLVEPGSPAQLARAIEVLITDRKRAQEMGQESLKIARSRFSWDRVARQTVAHYPQSTCE